MHHGQYGGGGHQQQQQQQHPPMPPAQQQMYGPQQTENTRQMWFQYSQCTGKKKALCVCLCLYYQTLFIDSRFLCRLGLIIQGRMPR
jgi:hypothetical protein